GAGEEARLSRARAVEVTRALSWLFTAVALVTVGALTLIFLVQSLPVWQHEGLRYITGARWFYRANVYGALPMIYGTLTVAVIALLLAEPIALGAAIFTSEFLSDRARLAVKIVIELLAGVPSVVYGLIGILLLRNWIYDLFARFDPLSGDTLLTAGVLLGVMILPTIMTLADDALRSVPANQRAAARGLGLTASETVFAVALPQAARGLLAALLLGLGRALGETIAVFLVVGRQDNHLPANILSPRAWLEAGQTLSSKLGGSETNIAYGDPLHWGAMVGLALIMMTMVLAVTMTGARQRKTRYATSI
ncbi:MAG: phosphate ABC transporter permease subunit PstC, partial [Verrucomicrobiota bacterium]|nr:phosphate ABC transporter permease subunit PstC [Verrucomicrobiota bacterium]